MDFNEFYNSLPYSEAISLGFSYSRSYLSKEKNQFFVALSCMFNERTFRPFID